MKLLVTGSSGMLGESLVPVLRENDHTVLATDIVLLDESTKHLDVRNLEEMLRVTEDFRPDMILHLAAETDLEVCESRVTYAYQENFVGTQNACVACHRHEIPIVYVSTAGVFDGTKQGPYDEFDRPNPINVYGASKYQGEQIVREILPRHFIVRAGWMIGGGVRDKKFVAKILQQLKDGQKELFVVTDKNGTPTYARSFSEVLAKIILGDCYGTYHVACKGSASRFDVASEIIRLTGQRDVKLIPVKSDFFRKEYFAPRPPSEELRNYVLELRSMNDMPHWRNALEEYIKRDFPEALR